MQDVEKQYFAPRKLPWDAVNALYQDDPGKNNSRLLVGMHQKVLARGILNRNYAIEFAIPS